MIILTGATIVARVTNDTYRFSLGLTFLLINLEVILLLKICRKI